MQFKPHQLVITDVSGPLKSVFHAGGKLFNTTRKYYSNCKVTALLEYFYNLLTVLLEYIDPTMHFPHFSQIFKKQFMSHK